MAKFFAVDMSSLPFKPQRKASVSTIPTISYTLCGDCEGLVRHYQGCCASTLSLADARDHSALCVKEGCRALERHLQGRCSRTPPKPGKAALAKDGKCQAERKAAMLATKQQRDSVRKEWQKDQAIKKAGVCLDFVKLGQCSRGKSCRFEHRANIDDIEVNSDASTDVGEDEKPKLFVEERPMLSASEEKEARKTEKMLRDIKAIQDRVAAGEKVDALQLNKIAAENIAKLEQSVVMGKIKAGWLRGSW